MPIKFKSYMINQAAAIGMIILSLMLMRVFIFYSGSDDRLIGIIPDDAFYYIKLAQHRISDGIWTFDGTAPATGFHLLYGYFLVLIFSVAPNIEWQELFLLIGAISSITISISAYYCVKLIGEIFDKRFQLIGIIPFLTVPVFVQSTSLMESWAVILLSTLSIYTVAHNNRNTNKGLFLILFLVGVFGSLSRTDYGLIAGVLFVSSFILKGIKGQNITIRALTLLTGAFFGLGIALLHNYHITGNFLQASAQIKFHWSFINGHSIEAPIKLLIKVLIPQWFPKWLIMLALISLLAAFLYSISQAMKSKYGGISSDRSVIFLACSLTLFGYMLVYRNNSEALQFWYSANFAAPAAIILSATIFYSMHNMQMIVTKITAFMFVLSALYNVQCIPYSHQSGMMKAGIFLQSMSNLETYGSWNAGIISYFSGKPLINLDGLANDDVIPYVTSNSLFDYIKERNISYLVDYSIMLERIDMRIRGGYDDWRSTHCITLEKVIDKESQMFGESRVSIFSIQKACQSPTP